MTDADAANDRAADAPQSEKDQRFEVAAAVLLGLATVAIAWGAYQANLWGGLQDKALTESVRLSTEAASEYEAAGSLISFDQSLFVEVVLQLNDDDADDALDAVDFLLTNMTPDGEAAVIEWFENDLPLPFTQQYYDTFYAPGNDLVVRSEAAFEDGSTNNTNGDKYVLVSTILASVLFFAGISAVLSNHRTRFVLLACSAVLWVGSVVYMTTLPVASL